MVQWKRCVNRCASRIATHDELTHAIATCDMPRDTEYFNLATGRKVRLSMGLIANQRTRFYKDL